MAEMFAKLRPLLDERQRRALAGVIARVLGRGGVAQVATASGMSRKTVSLAVAEVDAGLEPSTRVRRPGAGRKRLVDLDPDLLLALDDLIEPESRGDPMCRLRWTCKSTRNLADELTAQGHPVSSWTVGVLLHYLEFSLQANAKQREGAQSPDRDAQFHYLNGQVTAHLRRGWPVISVDTKKKETLGNLKNNGRTWEPEGSPVEVDTHDFPDPVLGKAIPYGVFDLAANEGFVVVGDDHDTAEFATATIGRWWDKVGAPAYPKASHLLITADAGGSNGYRVRAWKTGIARLAASTGLSITICHFPPGTSKWNKVEHRLFSAITSNWRGRPLTSHEVVVELIAATTTRTGLKVQAERDTGSYPIGVKVTAAELAALPLTGHRFHPEWNYTIGPGPKNPKPVVTR
jgi:Rhodopirellula transposase DDE domain